MPIHLLPGIPVRSLIHAKCTMIFYYTIYLCPLPPYLPYSILPTLPYPDLSHNTLCTTDLHGLQHTSGDHLLLENQSYPKRGREV